MTVSQTHLRENFDYRDGELIWRPRPARAFRRPCDYARWLNKHEGKVAGFTDRRGYVQINVDGWRTLAHRVIWTWHNGPIPPGMEIDHFDGDPRNNRIENLRCVAHAVNLTNRKRLRSNSSGHTSVSWVAERRKWRARSYIGGSRHLGYFDSKEAAEAAVRQHWAETGCTERHGV